jgi:uncharacterized membrane protein
MAHPRPLAATFLHPLHAILLAFPVALFPAAVASDITYLNTAVVQWSHFSAWLIAGGLLFGAPVVLWAIAGLIRPRAPGLRGRALLYLVLVALMWVIGLVNAFKHSADAWSSVGTLGLVLSIVTAVLALVAGWIGYGTAATTAATTEVAR